MSSLTYFSSSSRRPEWAPRVRQKDIQRLYDTDAGGVYDEFLIDDVGCALMLRCESFIAANEAGNGRVQCPNCNRIVLHSARKDEILECDCGWTCPWKEYFKTIQGAQLSGAEPVLRLFRIFLKTFPSAKSPQEKMLAIDRLLHGFHGFYKNTSYDEDPDGKPMRPVAVNLIEGRLREVVAFLDQLTYSRNSTSGTLTNRLQWREKIKVNRTWYETSTGDKDV